MDASPHAITPLRQRMLDDMRMRKLADKTQSHYLRAVRQLTAFLGCSPDTATIEDLRRYQLHLVDHGVSPVSLKAAITGLKVFSAPSMTISPKLTPIRNSMRRRSWVDALRSAIALWIATAQVTASTALPNSTSAPSPMVLTMRPRSRATAGLKTSAQTRLSCRRVPVSSSPMSRV